MEMYCETIAWKKSRKKKESKYSEYKNRMKDKKAQTSQIKQRKTVRNLLDKKASKLWVIVF